MASLADKTRQEWTAKTGELGQSGEAIIGQIEQLEAENQWLKEQFRLAQHRQFGASSEKTEPVPEQPNLFNEAEAVADATPAEVEIEQITYGRRKLKGQRGVRVENLPIEDIDYVLPEADQVCPQCRGDLHDMGVDIRSEVKSIPASYVLVRHKQHKYACRHCQQEETTTPIVTAAMPTPAFPGSLASPSAVAHIMTQKFVMGSPLYRLEQQFERQDFQLSRQTMANWMIRGAGWLEVIYDRMRTTLLSGDVIHADESTLQVLKEPGRAATTDSYMWLYRSGREGPPIALFEYQPTRAREHPKEFLKDFSGYLNVDGYGGYESLSSSITLVGCWAHARRKFDEAVKALPPAARKNGKTTSHAGLDFCNRLFKIERELQTASPEQRYAARLEQSKAVLDEFKTWLDAQATVVVPKSALGTAIAYCNNQWAKLGAFLLDGRLEIDNNRSERTIKPFVIGRKNWLFSNTPRGAKASAVIYSIVETAKENGLDPFAYLTQLFETMPNIDVTDPDAVANRLPWAESVRQGCAVNRPR